jgi:hypothetical protein
MTKRGYTFLVTDQDSDHADRVGEVTDRRRVRAGHFALDVEFVGGDVATLDEDQTEEI